MNDAEKQRNFELAEQLLAEQNFRAAVVAGVVATLLAAIAYGLVVAKWPFAYGFAVAGVGIVVGMSMQFPGRGIETKFALAAVVFTILACLLGNLVQALLSQGDRSLSVLVDRTAAYLTLGNMIYFFIAAFAAAFLVKRPLSRAQRLALGVYRMRGQAPN